MDHFSYTNPTVHHALLQFVLVKGFKNVAVERFVTATMQPQNQLRLLIPDIPNILPPEERVTQWKGPWKDCTPSGHSVAKAYLYGTKRNGPAVKHMIKLRLFLNEESSVDYHPVKLLGQGTYGSVWMFRLQKDDSVSKKIRPFLDRIVPAIAIKMNRSSIYAIAQDRFTADPEVSGAALINRQGVNDMELLTVTQAPVFIFPIEKREEGRYTARTVLKMDLADGSLLKFEPAVPPGAVTDPNTFRRISIDVHDIGIKLTRAIGVLFGEGMYYADVKLGNVLYTNVKDVAVVHLGDLGSICPSPPVA